MKLLFSEPRVNLESPLSIAFHFDGIKLKFDKPWLNVESPISLYFDKPPFYGITLKFDKPWVDNTSPITLRFGDGEVTPPLPIDNTIGIECGITWVKPSVAESQLVIAERARDLEVDILSQWRLNNSEIALLSSWASFHSKGVTYSAPWQIKVQTCTDLAIVYTSPNEHDAQLSVDWLSSPLHQLTLLAAWLDVAPHQLDSSVNWRDAEKHVLSMVFSYRGLVCDDETAIQWGPHAARWICSTNYRPPEPGLFTLRFSDPWTQPGNPLVLRFSPSPKYCYFDDGGGLIDANPSLPPIDFEIPIEPQLRRAYIMQPTIDCIRVSDSKRIVINSVSLNHSRGQYSQAVSIGFSSRIDAENAENQLLKLSLNGYDFYFICEEKAESKLFGSHTFTANGRSRSAELATPYELPVSYTNSTGRSFAGILSDLIQYSPWSVSLNGVTDFTIPAGVFSTSGKSPLEAINDAAEEVGCMVLSDDATQTLTVVPRWPTVPWLMSGANADITVHEAVILAHSMKETRQVLCNSVWIRGEQQGVSCQVKRAGTAGNVNAADISNQLIVDNQAARTAGTVALADTGKKRIHNISLPIMADLPPLTVGMLVGVRDGASLFKSVCDSVNISANVSDAGEISIEQAITVIESLE